MLMYGASITVWGLGESTQQHSSFTICLGKVMVSSESLSKLAGTASSASVT